MDVSGKSALVTGGGSGIGRGIALVLARNGADVAVADLNADPAGAVAAEVEALGRRSLGVGVDVTDRRSVDAMVSRVMDSFGRIDILVNNAGIIAAPGWEGRERSNDDDWDQIYEVNVKGIVHVTEAVTPQMIERRYGKIVNIASGAGRVGSPSNPPYNVSKAGVISYTQASALELAPHNINVNSICPGLLWTPMWERIATRGSAAPENVEGLNPRQWFERGVAERIPLGREQTPEDIGNLAAFLASDYAKNISGQAINVNGGSRMDRRWAGRPSLALRRLPLSELAIQANVAMNRELGVSRSTITPTEAKELVPQAEVDDIAIGIWEPEWGYADPVATTYARADQAIAYGVEVPTKTAVTSLGPVLT